MGERLRGIVENVWVYATGECDAERARIMLVEPVKMTTLSGDQLDACKDVPSRIDFNYSIPDGYDQDIKDFIKGKQYPYGSW